MISPARKRIPNRSFEHDETITLIDDNNDNYDNEVLKSDPRPPTPIIQKPIFTKKKKFFNNPQIDVSVNNNVSKYIHTDELEEYSNHHSQSNEIIYTKEDISNSLLEKMIAKIEQLEYQVKKQHPDPSSSNTQSEEEEEDLEALPPKEKEKLRLEYLDEIVKMGNKYPNMNFTPPMDPNISLNYIRSLTKVYKKNINKFEGSRKVRFGLHAVLWGIEYGLKWCKVSAVDGFYNYQKQNIQTYENIILEITDTYFSESTGELILSVEQRAIGLILLQFLIFGITKMSASSFSNNPMIKTILSYAKDYIETTVTPYFNNTPNTTPVSSNNNNTSTKTETPLFFNNTSSSHLTETPVMIPKTSPLPTSPIGKKRSPPKTRKEV